MPVRLPKATTGAIILKSWRRSILSSGTNWHHDGRCPFLMLVTGSDLVQARCRTRSSRPHSLLASSVPFSRCTIGGGTRTRWCGGALVRHSPGMCCTSRPCAGWPEALRRAPKCAKRFRGGFSTYTHCPGKSKAVPGRQVTVWVIELERQSRREMGSDRVSQPRRDT